MMGDKEPDLSGIELDSLNLPDLPDDEASQEGGETELLAGILESLDREMKSGRFLHTFTAQIAEINEIVRMEYASSRDIAQVILKDVSVASKVLALVNSAYYGRFGKEGVTSIAEAMVILGTEAVQQTASTLLLFEFMQDMAKGDRLKEKSLSSLMRGIMGREIAETVRREEKDAFQLICMLYDIGEQVLIFCKPEVHARILEFAMREGLSVEHVSKKMLGVSFSEIGRGIGLGWGFPRAILDGLRPFDDFEGKKKKLSVEDLKRLVASFTYEMCNMERPLDREFRKKRVEEIVRRYSRFLVMDTVLADRLLDHALAQMESHAKILKIRLKDTRFDRSAGASVRGEEGGKEGGGAVFPEAGPPVTVQSLWVEKRIAAMEKEMQSSFRLSDFLLQIITTIYKGFFFSRIAICILDKTNGKMTPRFVLGDDIGDFGRSFGFRVREEDDDVFNKVLNTGLDIVVDADMQERSSRIPDWYVQGNFAPFFALYPLLVEKKKIGLLYVDWGRECNCLFSNEVKVLMLRLKDLVLTAIRKSRI